jgi:hypothetical protein
VGRRRSSILLAMLCCLLAVSAPLPADGEWVLWSRLAAVSSPVRFTPVSGILSFDQCAAKESRTSRTNDTEAQTMRDMGVTSLTFTCLPESSDPGGQNEARETRTRYHQSQEGEATGSEDEDSHSPLPRADQAIQ